MIERTMMKSVRLVVLLICAFGFALIAEDSQTVSKVREFRKANENGILKEYVSLLSIPNVASDTPNIRKNAGLILQMLEARKLKGRLLRPADPNAPPAIFAESNSPGATRTLLFYAHYDGQPVTPSAWTVTQPWNPLFKLPDGSEVVLGNSPIDPQARLYARSASDDKAGVMAILTAWDAIRNTKIPGTSNLKFFFEGEEEAGSTHLAEIAKANRDLLKADAWIMIDGPVHQSGRKQVVFGVRGDTNVDVIVYGPKRPLHSGHYGNWAPNPAMLLARLLATMKDEQGKVTIAGWYDDEDPLTASELEAIANAPSYDPQLKKELGLVTPDGGGKSLIELIHMPSLNINGFASGDVGDKARNVIPTNASAVLDLRLVKGNDYMRQVEKLKEHIRKQGYYVIDRDPTDQERLQHPMIAKVIHRSGGYNAQRTPMDLPISKFVVDAVQSTQREPIIRMPTSGGSLPLIIITDTLGVSPISVPLANHDNNQHAEDENIRLQNLWDGIETIAAIMTAK